MNALLPALLELAIEIQQIPAPTFQETARAAFLHARFEQEGLTRVSTDDLGNVYACLPGSGTAAPVVISAHTDTVFPAGTPLHITRTPETIAGPGLGDNSLGVAGLFAIVWGLRARGVALPGDVWLAANVGEEGLGDLKGMRAVVTRFGDQPRAYLVLEGMALGQVYHAALGVRRYRVTLETEGGHAWVDFGRPSAIHELAALITRLTRLPLPHLPRASLNVGTIQGGTSINTIAPFATFDLDLRSESQPGLAELEEEALALVARSNRPGVQARADLIGSRPAGELPPTHPLVQAASQALREQGLTPHLTIGSTDANIPLSLGLPAVCLGLTTGRSAHTAAEVIEIAPLQQGLAQILDLLEKLFQQP